MRLLRLNGHLYRPTRDEVNGETYIIRCQPTTPDTEKCPRCGAELELSGTTGMDGRFKDYCPECTFVQDSETRVMADEQPRPPFVELDPDDWGTGTVQNNGMLYVGRDHGGADVRWTIEAED